MPNDGDELNGTSSPSPEDERLLEVGRALRGQAHGVKNLLGNLAGGLYVLQSGLKHADQAKIGQGQDMLERNIGRLSSWFERLSDYGKGYTPHPEALDPVRTAQETAAEIEQSVKVPVRVESALGGTVATDPHLFKLAVGNLIRNGAESVAEDGPEDGEVSVGLSREGDRLVVVVTDGGPGLDPEALEALGRRRYTSRADHAGLGVLEALEVSRVLGGRLTWNSVPDGGARFQLELPATTTVAGAKD